MGLGFPSIYVEEGFAVREWIKECILSSMLIVLISGYPKCFFPATRGLRHGDPLSPFLFVMAGEALSRMITTSVSANLIKGFELAVEAP